MRIVRNIGHVKRRKRIGRWSAVIGFLLLASTFFLIFFPQQIVAGYVLLMVGFVAFNYGMQQIGKWSNTARHPRNDLAIDERLNSLPDKYAILHYMQLGKVVVEHLLIFPGGLLVITAKDVPGVIMGRGSRWKRRGGGLFRLFGMSGPQLGNPTAETDRSILAVEKVLEENQLEYDVYGILLFTAESVELDVEETDFDAITLSDLEQFVRDLPADPTFKLADRDRLLQILTHGEELEQTERSTSRRPVRVKRRAMSKT